ncbi:serine threonine-protein kinase nek7 [Pelomyxa schiedti]|nr:serine threonine-protein kinase nek7 [Pelomyxa schiedti]
MSRISDYELVKMIGKGAYGQVWKARRRAQTRATGEDSYVVVKLINVTTLTPQELSDVANEAAVLRSAHHPNIVKFLDSFVSYDDDEDDADDGGQQHDRQQEPSGTGGSNVVTADVLGGGGGGGGAGAGEQGGGRRAKEHHGIGMNSVRGATVAIVMEYAPGGDLAAAAKMKAASRCVVAWGTVVFLDKDGNAKLGDFGFSKLLDSQSLAYSGVGTPLYMSPEICLNKPYNEKSDVWSLGCLMYELATLRPPFTASNQILLAQKITQEQPASIPKHYSSDLCALIFRMLEKDQTKRPEVSYILNHSSARLWQERAQLCEEANRLRQRLADIETQNRELRVKLETTQTELFSSIDTLSIIQDENQILKVRVEVLENECSDLRVQLDAVKCEDKPTKSISAMYTGRTTLSQCNPDDQATPILGGTPHTTSTSPSQPKPVETAGPVSPLCPIDSGNDIINCKPKKSDIPLVVGHHSKHTRSKSAGGREVPTRYSSTCEQITANPMLDISKSISPVDGILDPIPSPLRNCTSEIFPATPVQIDLPPEIAGLNTTSLCPIFTWHRQEKSSAPATIGEIPSSKIKILHGYVWRNEERYMLFSQSKHLLILFKEQSYTPPQNRTAVKSFRVRYQLAQEFERAPFEVHTVSSNSHTHQWSFFDHIGSDKVAEFMLQFQCPNLIDCVVCFRMGVDSAPPTQKEDNQPKRKVEKPTTIPVDPDADASTVMEHAAPQATSPRTNLMYLPTEPEPRRVHTRLHLHTQHHHHHHRKSRTPPDETQIQVQTQTALIPPPPTKKLSHLRPSLTDVGLLLPSHGNSLQQTAPYNPKTYQTRTLDFIPPPLSSTTTASASGSSPRSMTAFSHDSDALFTPIIDSISILDANADDDNDQQQQALPLDDFVCEKIRTLSISPQPHPVAPPLRASPVCTPLSLCEDLSTGLSGLDVDELPQNGKKSSYAGDKAVYVRGEPPLNSH